MKKVEIIEGVVAEYNGKYWGIQYQDGGNTHHLQNRLTHPDGCLYMQDMV